MSYQFTSESVSEGHPDKVADAISDALATHIIDGNLNHRAAVETLVTTNFVGVAGEYKSSVDLSDQDVEQLVRDTVKNIGYEQAGFNWANLEVQNRLHFQSADIALGTDNFGAGDQGLMFGYASKETPEYMPLAISLSHKIVERLAWLRKNDPEFAWLEPDAKSQVTIEYLDASSQVAHVSKVVCSTQHKDSVDIDFVREQVQQVIRHTLGGWIVPGTEFLINPTGRFVVGGPDGDTGLTGRKIIVDTYGGYCPHGGGAFSGKDATKVDRSAAYMARYLAKNLVAERDVRDATVQLSYAIGVTEPTSVYVYADGKVRSDLAESLRRQVDLTPLGIINRFDLMNLDLTRTTNYGHFGKPDLPWEQIDLYK